MLCATRVNKSLSHVALREIVNTVASDCLMEILNRNVEVGHRFTFVCEVDADQHCRASDVSIPRTFFTT